MIKTIKDKIRAKNKKKIKGMAGKMKFTASAGKLRHRDRRLG